MLGVLGIRPVAAETTGEDTGAVAAARGDEDKGDDRDRERGRYDAVATVSVLKGGPS
jgi:hypothetical protein